MQTLGNYTLQTVIGTGSTGTVWKAHDNELQRLAAIKILDPHSSQDLLRAEARILASLDHPNIVQLYDFVEAGPDPTKNPAWLAEQWIDGKRLDDFVAALGSKRLTGEQAVGVIRGALLGLAYAHDSSVVHGDVSAGNILIDETGTSKVIDFGLASPTGKPASSGTPAFMSPEAVHGQPATPASDVYSAASVLYYLLDGQPPFGADNVPAVMARHVSEPPPQLAGHGSDLADVLTRAMAKEPAARPQDAAAFLADLEDAATRRYGAGWLTRASIASLVVAPAAATAATAELTGGAAAIEHATGAIVATAQANLGAAHKPLWRNPAVLAAAAVAVVAATVGIAVASSGGGDNKAQVVTAPAAQPTSTTPSPTPTPSLPAVAIASRRLVGKYRVVEVVTATTLTNLSVGASYTHTWTISKGCLSAPCRVSISSSSGRSFTGTFNGTLLTIVFPTTSARDVKCVDDVTHAVLPGITALDTEQSHARLTFNAGGPLAPLFSGTAQQTDTASNVEGGQCRLNPPDQTTYKYTGKRV